MQHIPKLNGLHSVLENPTRFKISVKSFRSGKAFDDLFRYRYASLFCLNQRATSGATIPMYRLYKFLNPQFGLENSSITSLPPGFKTLSISKSPFSRFSKFLTPNATITASNVFSLSFIVSE